MKKRGGIWFWRVGRLSGSVTLSKRRPELFERETSSPLWISLEPEADLRPFALGYGILAAVAVSMLTVWLIIGIKSGFVL